MLDSELFRTTIRPFLVFVFLMVGISALLQDSLFIYKLADAYTHWAIILLGLPLLIGILLRLLETKQPLLVTLAGAAVSTFVLYYLYKHHFWAEAPTLLNALFLFAVIVGGAHLPYSRGPIAKLFSPLFSRSKVKGKPTNKGKSATSVNKKSSSRPVPQHYSRGTAVTVIEFSMGIASLMLSVYSIVFMGKG